MTEQDPIGGDFPPEPDWRWRQGVERAGGGGAFSLCKDKGVRDAERYWRLRASCRDEAARRRLARSMPRVHQAYAIFQERSGTRRAVLEARVLAGEPGEEIARKGGLSADVVGAYELLFFDVRGRLAQRDYVLSWVLAAGPRRGQGEAEAQRERFWKVAGYLGGGLVLDTVLHGRGALQRPRNEAEADSFLVADARAEVLRRVALAARGGLADPRTLEALARALARLTAGQEGEAGHTPYEAHVQAMMEDIPWTVGPDGGKSLPKEVAELDEGATELRDEEILRLAAGQKVEGLDEVKNYKMPPPKPKAKGPTSSALGL